MSSQQPSLSQISETQTTRQSADVEYEAAEQLLQHSRKGREGNGDTMTLVAEHTSLPDFVTNFGNTSEEQKGDGGPQEQSQEEQNSSQDRQADANYAVIPPALGQVCR